MKFNNIHKDINHSCITDKVKEDTESYFLRKMYKSTISEEEFQSYWEMGKRTKSQERICIFKGLSISRVENGNEEEVLKNFTEDRLKTIALKPHAKKHNYYCKLQFRKNAGMLWKTGINKYHYTFFKCDEFTVASVDIKYIGDL
jgi:hypothetical protein